MYRLGNRILHAGNKLVYTKGIPKVMIYDVAGTYTFTVPEDVKQIIVECIGGGASGVGGTTNGHVGGGGGGGAYAKKTFAVSAGQNYTLVVGAGGATHISSIAGGDTWFSANTILLAKGAPSAGSYGNNLGGQGGSLTLSRGDVKYAGGNGGDATYYVNSGGGGGGAWRTTGNNGVGITGGAAIPDYGGGGGDGILGSTITISTAGKTGFAFGGGGGGAYMKDTYDKTGGAGMNGIVVISW